METGVGFAPTHRGVAVLGVTNYFTIRPSKESRKVGFLPTYLTVSLWSFYGLVARHGTRRISGAYHPPCWLHYLPRFRMGQANPSLRIPDTHGFFRHRPRSQLFSWNAFTNVLFQTMLRLRLFQLLSVTLLSMHTHFELLATKRKLELVP